MLQNLTQIRISNLVFFIYFQKFIYQIKKNKTFQNMKLKQLIDKRHL